MKSIIPKTTNGTFICYSAVLILLIFSSCMSVQKTIKQQYRYEMYIDYPYVSFQGNSTMQEIYLEIDSINGIRYVGKVVLDNTDTITVNGFEKGGFYPTWYTNAAGGKGMLEIWCRTETGQIPDSITISDRDLNTGIIKEETTLYRQPRKSCN